LLPAIPVCGKLYPDEYISVDSSYLNTHPMFKRDQSSVEKVRAKLNHLHVLFDQLLPAPFESLITLDRSCLRIYCSRRIILASSTRHWPNNGYIRRYSLILPVLLIDFAP
jgi:hypothetical protein